MVEMPKLQSEPFWLLILFPRDTLLQHKVTVELKTSQQHCPSKEPIAGVGKVETPSSVVLMKTKVVEKELETPKTTSSDPSLRRVSTRKKKKEPTLEPSIEMEKDGSFEDVEELKVVSSSEELVLEEEEEAESKPETPPPKKTRIKGRTSEWKKATPALKIPVSTKRPAKEKILEKGESSQKKPSRK